MDPDIHVNTQYRDAVFKKLKQTAENQFCFDCNLKNPSWCSVILGIFICYNCATPHRSMGTHLSFVRSSELDMWTLRQLSFLEQAGNKSAKSFFRSHGVTTAVDYSSQIAERWRNELQEKVLEIYPKKAETVQTLKEETKTETKPQEIKPLTHEQPEERLEAKPIQPIVNKPIYKIPTGESKHKFRKAKVEDTPATSFKPVSFKQQTEEEEFFDPQPLKAPAKVNQDPIPAPVPHVIQRKQVEKKGISSEDYEAQFVDPRVQKARITQFAGASAISSDMYFGKEQNSETDLAREKFREEATRLGSLALDKAVQLKGSLSGAFSSLQSRFNSYN